MMDFKKKKKKILNKQLLKCDLIDFFALNTLMIMIWDWKRVFWLNFFIFGQSFNEFESMGF